MAIQKITLDRFQDKMESTTGTWFYVLTPVRFVVDIFTKIGLAVGFVKDTIPSKPL